MVTITIDLRKKNIFLYLSVITFSILLFSIHTTSLDVDLTSFNLLSFYGLSILTALFWWTPYQFIGDFS